MPGRLAPRLPARAEVVPVLVMAVVGLLAAGVPELLVPVGP